MAFKQTVGTYYRLAKPGIIYANVMTAAAGYIFAAGSHFDVVQAVSLLISLGLVIGGACVYNNYLDRGIDRSMKRTESRALVTGKITGRQALLFATILTSAGLAGITLMQNILTLILICIAFVDYVVLYGIGKRVTVHGTLVGCIAGSLPLTAGYVAATGRFDLTASLLFALMVVWQMAHFYGIALFRLRDYKQAGIPVMPAVHGTRITQWQVVMYICLFSASIVVLMVTGALMWPPGLVLLAVSVWWLVSSTTSMLRDEAAPWGKQVFVRSLSVLLVMSGVIVVNPFLELVT